MRYSALQEDSYGVSLGQCTSPNDVDKSMMAATGDVEPGGDTPSEEGSMISNLPLLFANGYPTSLEKITLTELERFVTFMVQCSLGHEAAEEISEPQWWPKEVKFSFPLAKPKKANDIMYMANLKKLVFRCYTYHRGEYLLRFCAYLAQYPRDKLEYVNNWDATTSLYLKTTGKLLVTFRNENMNYDKKLESSRRSLLSMKKSSYPNSTKCLRRRSGQKRSMVEPITDDIYLCDNCDAEFVGLYRMKEHEKLCYRPEPRPITPEVEELPELKQDQFMEYFMLRSKTAPSKRSTSRLSPYLDDYGDQIRSSGRIRGSVNLTRCPTIPFSSPAGLALAKKSKMMSEVIQQERLDRIERHTYAPALCSVNAKPKWFSKTHDYEKWNVTYKPSKSEEPHYHHYKFGNHTKKPALDLRSQLLLVACKPIYVRMTRQTDEELAHLMEEPSRYKTPEREIPRVALRRSPSVEALSEPCGEPQPIVIELDDDEPSPADCIHTAPTPPPPPVRAATTIYRHSLPPLPTTSLPSPSSSVVALSGRRGLCGPRSKKRARHSEPPVVLVDLCSSDEDDALEQQPDSRSGAELLPGRESEPSPTELRVLEQPSFVRASHGMQLTPSKLCAKPCVHPADSTSGWIAPIARRPVGLFKQAAAYFRTGP